jgi:hypothetical protein
VSRVVVDYEELRRMSSVWREAATALARLGCQVAALVASPQVLANAVFAPAAAARFEVAVTTSVAGPHGLAALAGRLAVDSALLTAVVTKEQLVDDLPLHQLRAVGEWAATLPVAIVIDPKRAVREGERRAVALADALPGYLAPFVEPLAVALAPSPLFRLEAAGRRPLTVDPIFGLPVTRLAAASQPGPGGVATSTYLPAWRAAPAGSMAELLRRVGDLELQDRASIAIERVVGTDGVTRFVVLLSGMRRFTDGSDPEDLLGAVAAAVGRSSTYTRCVREALDAAGVPLGAPVLLVGHSQGAIVAMDLAGDPDLNGARVRVVQVIAAASPVSSKAVAPGSHTRVFSIENARDIVTHLDAVNSPDTRQDADRLTYRFADDEHDVGANHDVDLYADRLDDLADSPNPLLHEVETGVRPFLVGSATTTVFTLTNRPEG